MGPKVKHKYVVAGGAARDMLTVIQAKGMGESCTSSLEGLTWLAAEPSPDLYVDLQGKYV